MEPFATYRADRECLLLLISANACRQFPGMPVMAATTIRANRRKAGRVFLKIKSSEDAEATNSKSSGWAWTHCIFMSLVEGINA